jgi:MFS family permease
VVLGVVEGVAEGTAGITKYFAGRWSDRRSKKGFIGAGYTLAALGKAVVAAAVGWPMVLVGRVLDRFGKGIRSAPRDALIAESVPNEAMGKAFGFHRMGDSLGAVIGPLLGLAALAALHHNVRAAMWWAMVPAAISASLVMLVRERHHEADGIPKKRAPIDRSVPLPRRFRVITATVVLIALVNFSDVLLLLRVSQLGFSTTQVVLAYVVFNTVYTLGSYPAGALSDRMPHAAVYAVGLAAFAVAYLGLGLVHHSWVVFLLAAIYGMFPAFTDGVGKAWVATTVDRSQMGRAQGVFQSFNNGAVLLAGVWAGVLWKVGAGKGRVPLLVSGSIAAVAALVMFVVAMSGRRRAAV